MTLLIGRTIGKVLFYFKEVQNEKYSVRSRKHYFYQRCTWKILLWKITRSTVYGRSATSIENKSTIEYGTEQGLAALIYGEQGVSSLPIQDITGEYIDTDNEYMYYYSAEFVK